MSQLKRRMTVVEEARRQQKEERGWTLDASADQSRDAGKSRPPTAAKKMSVRAQSSLAVLEGAVDSMGLQRVGRSEMVASGSRAKSAEQVVEEEYASYLARCKDITMQELPPTGLNEWWKTNMFHFKNAAVVFRQIAGKPNSAGCLENDFSSAADMWNLKRTVMDTRYADAQLFCNLNFGLCDRLPKQAIPSDSIANIDERMPAAGFGSGICQDGPAGPTSGGAVGAGTQLLALNMHPDEVHPESESTDFDFVEAAGSDDDSE
jgi:hypothetical protein